MNSNSVSVIIPAYNVSASLQKCLDSVLNQTLPPSEIIVINDGSTDDTSIVAKSYGNKILYLEQPNAGQGAARNAGLAVASGEYIAFLDADDYWEPRFIEITLKFMREQPGIIAALTGWKKIGLEGLSEIVPPIMLSEEKPEKGIVIENFFQFWACQGNLQTGAILVRHDVIKQAGFQRADLRISQDLEYWAFLATFGSWGFIPEVLYCNNSRRNAYLGGWTKKYRQRRRLCPTVESWEERIIPRLKAGDREYFSIIRGNIAASYAHSKLFSGSLKEAFEIVGKFGDSMPDNRLTQLMRVGNRLGLTGRIFVFGMVRLREHYKDLGTKWFKNNLLAE